MQKEQKTYLYIILAFSFILFAIYLILVATKNAGIMAFDQSVAQYFYNHRTRVFDYFFVIISYLGETFVLIGFCAVLLILPNRNKLGIPITIITLLSMLINLILKYIVMRARPQGLFLNEPTLFYSMPDGYSFPSGHAQQGVVFIVSLCILLSSQARRNWIQIFVLTAGICLSVLMCLSRVYLCVHFLSDVLCGLSLALIMLSIGYLVRDHFVNKHIITINTQNSLYTKK